MSCNTGYLDYSYTTVSRWPTIYIYQMQQWNQKYEVDVKSKTLGLVRDGPFLRLLLFWRVVGQFPKKIPAQQEVKGNYILNRRFEDPLKLPSQSCSRFALPFYSCFYNLTCNLTCNAIEIKSKFWQSFAHILNVHTKIFLTNAFYPPLPVGWLSIMAGPPERGNAFKL